MNYRLELYDIANTAKVGDLRHWQNCRLVTELLGENRLSFELASSDPLAASLQVRKYLRVTDNATAGYNSFIIERVQLIKGADGLKYSVECEALKYALMDHVLAAKTLYVDVSATTALTILLAGSGFTVGTMNPATSNLKTIEFDFPTGLSGLQQIIDTWYYDDSGRFWYYYKINENKSIDILTIGNIGTLYYFYITPPKNLREYNSSSDAYVMANRIYGKGSEGFSLRRANAVHFFEDYFKQGFSNTVESSSEFNTGGLLYALQDQAYMLGLGIVHYNGGFGGDLSYYFYIVDRVDTELNTITPTAEINPTALVNDTLWVGGCRVGDSFIYDFEIVTGGTANPIQYQSRILINCYCDANFTAGTAGDTCTFNAKVSSYDGSDNLIKEDTYALVAPYADGYVDTQIAVEVGELTNIYSIKCELVSAVYSGASDGDAMMQFAEFDFWLGPNSAYIDDSTSQTTYGVVADIYENSEIEDIRNLVATPALDGTYTGGLCADWIETGTPTTTENTTLTYVKHGTKSQKVVTDAANEGIVQDVYIKANTAYSAYFNIYIDAADPGQIEIKISQQDGTTDVSTESVTGMGWTEITIENFSIDDYIARIWIRGTSGMTFYVDAVMIHEGTEVRQFVKGDAADLLYAESYADLQAKKNPEVSYSLDLLNLYELDRDKFSAENFNVGDRVRVVDPDLSLDSQLLVVRKEYTLENPQDCRIELSNRKDSFRKSIGRAIQNIKDRNLPV